MCPLTIPSSATVVTEAFVSPVLASAVQGRHDTSCHPVRLEHLYPGARPVLTNAPSGKRVSWRCGAWQREAAFQSVSGVCASCRWSLAPAHGADAPHQQEVCHAAQP